MHDEFIDTETGHTTTLWNTANGWMDCGKRVFHRQFDPSHKHGGLWTETEPEWFWSDADWSVEHEESVRMYRRNAEARLKYAVVQYTRSWRSREIIGSFQWSEQVVTNKQAEFLFFVAVQDQYSRDLEDIRHDGAPLKVRARLDLHGDTARLPVERIEASVIYADSEIDPDEHDLEC